MRVMRRLSLAASRDRSWPSAFGSPGLHLSDPARRPSTARPPIPRPPRSWSCARGRRAAHGDPVVRDQRWVPYARISPNLKRAVLVTEDSAFWQHEGDRLEQLRESVEVNLERGEFARGASTITQQLAKNLYLSPSKNPIRKVTRAADHAPPRGRAVQAADPRAVPERRSSGATAYGAPRRRRATLFPQVRRGVDRPRIGVARRRDRQPAHPRSRRIRQPGSSGDSR